MHVFAKRVDLNQTLNQTISKAVWFRSTKLTCYTLFPLMHPQNDGLVLLLFCFTWIGRGVGVMAEWGRGLVLCVGILAGGMHPSIDHLVGVFMGLKVGLGEEYHYKKMQYLWIKIVIFFLFNV